MQVCVRENNFYVRKKKERFFFRKKKKFEFLTFINISI